MRDEELFDYVDTIPDQIKRIEALIDKLEAKRQHLQEEYEDEMIARHGWQWPFTKEGEDK